MQKTNRTLLIVSSSGDIHIAVTRSKLPEPTETPPPPIVAKPKK